MGFHLDLQDRRILGPGERDERPPTAPTLARVGGQVANLVNGRQRIVRALGRARCPRVLAPGAAGERRRTGGPPSAGVSAPTVASDDVPKIVC
ncbi:hypothetical protein [Fimbriiglobus ruber]|uniref:hypothetical protein n=1 Tax=Fimbriiglobus ruber TaxID=1908690 RepID=UPI001179B4A7|nr:hypothetical protein [Fimbriiglobus ruber]